ncbi:MAG: ATP-binding protein [Ilumatobacteraceae bacterium]
MDRFQTLTPRPALFPTALTILKAIVAARWLAWIWMAGIIAFSAEVKVRHPVVGWIAVALTLTLTAVSTVLLRRSPERLLHAPFVIADVGFAVGLSVLDGYVFEPLHVFATSQSIATQWPLLAMATVGVAYGPVVAGLCGVMIGPAEWAGAELNAFDKWGTPEVVSIVATSLFFAACGVVFGWQARLLKRVEGEIADRRARDEVGRMLHDTVLQTLALVERRSAVSDPELATAARQADQDLRAFLFGSAGRVVADLETRIRAEVERVRTGHDTPVTVSVLDDGCRVPDRDQDLLARAIAEAVANALEHAGASRIVVYVETDDAGHVFASIDDDGTGFDPATPRQTHGIDESICGRIASIGGRVEISSEIGSGTEVCMWTRASVHDMPGSTR